MRITAITTQRAKKDNLWILGTIHTDEGKLKFEAKVYDEPSEYGIAEGRVSKLWISEMDHTTICEYDRGWDKKPATKHWELTNAIIGILELQDKINKA